LKIWFCSVSFVSNVGCREGFDVGKRENALGRDLNRDFPDQFTDRRDEPFGRQLETQAIMNWTRRYPFVLSGNLHEGDVVVNYPFDGTPDGRWTYSKAPDDTLLRYLARVYASLNPDMNSSRRFPGGITNGAQWYVLFGGMQDVRSIETSLCHIQHKLPPLSLSLSF
jgi:carboxypeptidase D